MLKSFFGFIKWIIGHHIIAKLILLTFAVHFINFGFAFWANWSMASLEHEEAIERFEICKDKLHTWDACKVEYHTRNRLPFSMAVEKTLSALPSCYIDDCSSILKTILNNLLVQVVTVSVAVIMTWGSISGCANYAKRKRYEKKRLESWSPSDMNLSQVKAIQY